MVLIFDFDGTIANTLPLAVGILNKLSYAFGYEKIKEEDVETLRSLTISDMRAYLKLSWLEVPLFLLRLRQELFNQVGLLKPVFGMEDLLSELKHREIPMGVITSNEEHVAKTFLDAHFPGYFDFMHFGTSLFGKDTVLRRVMEEHHLLPTDVVYVGDEVRDIQAAMRAGVQMVSVTWGLQSEHLLRKHSPHFLIAQPKELLQLPMLNE